MTLSSPVTSARLGFYDPVKEVQRLREDWEKNIYWKDIKREYTPEDVIRLRGSLKESFILANNGARRFRSLIKGEAKKPYVNALGALTSGQALQMCKAGLECIYVSGWQVAADNNTFLSTYPDQSLYPADSVPRLVKAINNAFRLADRMQWYKSNGKNHDQEQKIFSPIIADAEAGFGGVLNTYELCYHLIEAGASGIHLEDQLPSAKKCGHLGGKVLIPISEAIHKLLAARLAADVAGVPLVIIARTDAYSATLLTSDSDVRDTPFLTGKRSENALFYVKSGLPYAIARGLAFAPYADLLWCETSTPSLTDARAFAQAIHEKYPQKPLAYNCSPSFNWYKHLTKEEIRNFQEELSKMGYVFQFITLAGIHSSWYNIYDLAYHYNKGNGMQHYVEKVQEKEISSLQIGYTFFAHQQEVGTEYFDSIASTVQKGNFETSSVKCSLETEDFVLH